MSVMGGQSDTLHRRPIRTFWCGFEGTTARMASEGWDFAVNHHPWQPERQEVIARHCATGLVMYGNLHGFDLGGRDPFDCSQIVFTRMADEGRMVFQSAATVNWRRVDVSHDVMYEPVERKTLAQFGLFPPLGEPKEIITRPDQVAYLLEQIQKFQEPELQEIRQRNRTRELREAPEQRFQTTATILTLAA